MIKFLLLVCAVLAVSILIQVEPLIRAQITKAAPRECASIEECRASVTALKLQVTQLAELNKACANEIFALKLGRALALPQDMQKTLDDYAKPPAVAAKPDKKEVKQ